MIRIILFFLFFIMYAGGPLGLNVSLAPGISTKNLLLYILFTWIVGESVVMRNRRIDCKPVIILFGALLSYSVFSWLVVVLIVKYPNYDALQNAISLKSQMADLFFLLAVFLFATTDSKAAIQLYKAIVWLVILGNIVALADAFGLLNIEVLEWHKEGRLNGFLGQPNEYGAFLVIFLPATVALFLSEKGAPRILAGLGALATFICLLLTFSRGAYAGLAVGLLLGAFFLRKNMSTGVALKVATVTLLVTAAAIPVLYALGFESVFRDRFALLSGDAHAMTTGRSTLWSIALSVMLEHPISFLIGFGWNAYENFREFRLSIHNTYFNYLFNLGTIGLTLFLATLWAVAVTLRRGLSGVSGERNLYVLAAIVGILGVCVVMFVAEVFITESLLWAFIGLSLRIATEGQKEHRQKTEESNRSPADGARQAS